MKSNLDETVIFTAVDEMANTPLLNQFLRRYKSNGND